MSRVLVIEPGDLTEMYVRINPWDSKFEQKVRYVMLRPDPEQKLSSLVEYYYRLDETEYGQLDGGQGYVYILECKAQPGICKIGSTSRTPEDRCKEINRATGVIIPWELTEAFACKSPECVEKIVHEELRNVRISPQKEGFRISKEDAKLVINKVIVANKAELELI